MVKEKDGKENKIRTKYQRLKTGNAVNETVKNQTFKDSYRK